MPQFCRGLPARLLLASDMSASDTAVAMPEMRPITYNRSLIPDFSIVADLHVAVKIMAHIGLTSRYQSYTYEAFIQ